MRILVIGSSSLLGRHAGQILSKSHEVLYAGRHDADFQLDLSQAKALLSVDERFDAIVHCAADFGGDSEEDILRAEMTNAIGTLNVARIARQTGVVHLILVSSSSAANLPHHSYYNAYSLSKRHGEELATLFCDRFGLPLTILRPTQIYGDDERYAKHQPLFYHIVRKAAHGDDVLFYGSKDVERNLLHVDDFTMVLQGVLEQKLLGLHHVTSVRSYRLSEIAALAYDAFRTSGQINFDLSRPDIALVEMAEHSSTLAAAGLIPTIDLAEGLRRLRISREEP